MGNPAFDSFAAALLPTAPLKSQFVWEAENPMHIHAENAAGMTPRRAARTRTHPRDRRTAHARSRARTPAVADRAFGRRLATLSTMQSETIKLERKQRLETSQGRPRASSVLNVPTAGFGRASA